MRKLVFLSVFVSVCQFAQAQLFFDAGIKGGIGSTWFFNKEVMNDNQIKYGGSLSHTFGGKLSVNFNETYAVSGEFLYAHIESQVFKFTNSLNQNINRKISFNQYNIPILFRKNGETGDYFEIGPQFSLVQKVTDDEGKDVADNFKASYTNILIGFGHYLFGSGAFCGAMGARFTFSPSDILTTNGGKDNKNFYPFNTSLYNSNFKNYAATLPITAMLMLEFTYDLGYFAKSKCKRRAFMLF